MARYGAKACYFGCYRGHNASIPIITDALGFYSIRIPTGTHNLIATREPAFHP